MLTGVKRQKRRTRYIERKRLQELDAIALQKIQASFGWSMDTWGGSRCPGCGLGVRPHWLENLSHSWYSDDGKFQGHITAYRTACHKIKNCPGKRDWE